MNTKNIFKRLLIFATATVAFCGAVFAQEMQIPGQTTYSVNVLKPAPLPATDENVRSLKLPPGFTVTKFAEGIQKPRVLLVSPDAKSLYISNRDDGTIVMLNLADPAQRKTVRQKRDVHGMALHDGRLYYVTVREVYSAPINPTACLVRRQGSSPICPTRDSILTAPSGSVLTVCSTSASAPLAMSAKSATKRTPP